MTQRGDVVIVDFPFTMGVQSKVRPALVVQKNWYNQRLHKTIVAMISGNLRRVGEPAHLFVDPGTPDGAPSGLHGPSVVTFANLYTIDQTSIKKTIGQLPAPTMQKANDCLKAVLDIV